MSKEQTEIKHLRRKLRLARNVVDFVADYPANGNSEPDVMAAALNQMSRRACSAREAWACLDRQHRRKSG